MKISCISENDREYSTALKKVKTFNELVVLMEEYKSIAFDAYLAVKDSVTEESFDDFMKRLNKTRFANSEEDYDFTCGVVLIPQVMLRISQCAAYFKVPFGMAFIRLKEVGKIIDKNGVFEFSEKNG